MIGEARFDDPRNQYIPNRDTCAEQKRSREEPNISGKRTNHNTKKNCSDRQKKRFPRTKRIADAPHKRGQNRKHDQWNRRQQTKDAVAKRKLRFHGRYKRTHRSNWRAQVYRNEYQTQK